ncbi:MAG TPA: hypothetical protein VI685_06560 [Candidatus Angelobacter sp.]
MFGSDQLPLAKPILVSRPLCEGLTVFASGMNRLADIRGAAAAGVPIGVDVSRVSQRVAAEIIEIGVTVLLDSGAFSEVEVRRGEVHVVREIDDMEWKRRLALYLQIAKALRSKNRRQGAVSKVSIIAPDRVGSQEVTLLRLSKFRRQITEIRATGAAILVPLQCGALDSVEFYRAARTAVGVEIVPAFPMKKAPTTIPAILDFLTHVAVPRIHLLGMGANNRLTKALFRLVTYAHPGIQISMDANKIRAAVGKHRTITHKETQYCDEMSSGWTGDVDLREWGDDLHDMTEVVFQPSVWLKGVELKRAADSLTWLTAQQQQQFLVDPDAFVNADENQNDWLYQTLLERYVLYIKRRCRRSARTRAVFESFSNSPIAHQF